MSINYPYFYSNGGTMKKAIIFIETGEVRCPKKDEWYKYNDFNICKAIRDFTISKFPIYKIYASKRNK
jgi:hypothetical protein